jgi:hypothetical protein
LKKAKVVVTDEKQCGDEALKKRLADLQTDIVFCFRVKLSRKEKFYSDTIDFLLTTVQQRNASRSYRSILQRKS